MWTWPAWSPRVKLGPDINVNGTEIGAVFSPSGKSLLFARDAGESKSHEFASSGGAGELKIGRPEAANLSERGSDSGGCGWLEQVGQAHAVEHLRAKAIRVRRSPRPRPSCVGS